MEKIADILLKLIPQHKISEIHLILEDMNAVDMAMLYEYLPLDKFAFIFRLINKSLAGEVFANLDYDSQEALVTMLTDHELNEVLSRLFSDDFVDFIEEMPAPIVERILNITPSNRRQEINKLLHYPKESAGSLMTTEYISLRSSWTVNQAMAYVRAHAFNKETINIVYVVDESQKLIGILSIRLLMTASLDATLSSIMETNIKSIPTGMVQEEVADLFKKYGYIAMPVVDNEMKMVGIITVDDVLQVIEDENEEDFERMSALSPSDEPYLKMSAWSLANKRIVWLIILMIGGTIAGGIIGQYEALLSQAVVLMAYVPMLMSTGGNCGSQTSTLVIRGLALNEIENRDVWKVLWKEIRVALLVGSILSVLNYLRITLLGGEDPMVSLTVCLSMFAVVLLAKITGAFLPILAQALKMDPTVMAAPLITTIVDTMTLIIYFQIAHALVL